MNETDAMSLANNAMGAVDWDALHARSRAIFDAVHRGSSLALQSGLYGAPPQAQSYEDPSEPYRELRSLRSPARSQPPMPPGMTTDEVVGGMRRALVGDPNATVQMRVDEAGRPLAHMPLDEFRAQYPGATHPMVEAGAQLGMAEVGGPLIAAATRPAAQALQTAVKTAPYSTAGAGGILGTTLSGSEAGVETDRPSNSFEVPLPDPNPDMVKRRDGIEARMAKVEADFQARSAKQYPTAKARDLDAQQHREAMAGLRQDMKDAGTDITNDRNTRKGEKQAELKAAADVQKAKDERERPLMDKYPTLMSLPYLGGAFAVGTTYINRARQVEQYNAWSSRVGDQIKKVSNQLDKMEGKGAKTKKPSPESIQREKDVLQGYADEAPEMKALINPGFWGSIAEKGGPAAGGSMLAAELAMVPYQIDWATQHPDTAAGKEAIKRLTTLDGWLKTATSGVAGLTGATIGSSIPTRARPNWPDVKRAEVLSATAPGQAATVIQQRANQLGAGPPPPAVVGSEAWRARQQP